MEEFLDGLQRDEMAAEKKMKNSTRYDEWRARKLENPKIRAALEALQPAYVAARVRILAGKLSQRDADEAETLPGPEEP